MRINLDQYSAFRAAAKAGSVSKAAEELFISQPAVSQTLKQLEGRLGVALFTRTSRGIKLTPEGGALFAYIDQAFGLIEAGEAHIDRLKNLKSGDIRIGASDTLCKHYLLPALEDYHKTHPDVNVSVTNRTSHESLELLRSGQVDIAFLNMPLAADGVDIRPCYPVNDCVVVGKKYSDLVGKKLKWPDIQDIPLLMLEKLSNSRRFIDERMLALGITLQPVIELGSHDVLADFAKIGLGAAFVTRQFVQKELDSGELFELDLRPPLPTRDIGLATLRGIGLSFAAQSFVDFLTTR